MLALAMPAATANSPSAARDAAVLTDMYNSMGGANWPMNEWPSKWKMEAPETVCSWHNVTCNTDGRVIEVDLYYMEAVVGTLPNTLVDLSELKRLRLKGNPNLSGTIPEKIGKLKNLEELILGRDRVSGTIPHSLYGLEKLDTLYLKQNFMSGTLSEAIGNLKNLDTLDIRESKFYGLLPKAISTLARLRKLNIEDNAWRGFLPIPPGGLEECRLSDMKFTSTTYEERVATPIKTGYGESNAQFFCPLPTYVPPACRENLYCTTEPSMADAMNDCTVLYDMYLGMGGPNWEEEGSGKRIKWSHGEDPANCCAWEGVHCRHLDKRVFNVDLRGITGMEGTLPPSIGELGKLEGLHMKGTPSISGTIPEEIGLLSKLTTLEVGRDLVSGTIPFSLYGLVNLQELYLKQNKMSGTISEAIGALKQLNKLDLMESKFSGELPASISTLRKLQQFNVEDNAWRGFLPALPEGIHTCEISDKRFGIEKSYEKEQRQTVPRGADWDDLDSKFKCPLPDNLPKACQNTAFCVTDPVPGRVSAKPEPKEKFGMGLMTGLLAMLGVMVVLGVVLFVMRKTILRLTVTEAGRFGPKGTKSDSFNPSTRTSSGTVKKPDSSWISKSEPNDAVVDVNDCRD